MPYLYFGTIFAAMIIFLLLSLLLFSQHKEGERSRTMLACMNFISVLNYLNQIIYFNQHIASPVVMPVQLLLLGVFVISTYIMYPIEVISPGWLNRKRVLKLYLPVTALFVLYEITLALGVVYTPFESVDTLMSHIGSFEVIFRIVLALLFFLPAVFLYFVPYTRRYNNTNYKWMRGYVIVVVINAIGFLVVINSTMIIVRTLYYAISVSCSLYIAYHELFVRLIRQPEITRLPVATAKPKMAIGNNEKASSMFERLEQYVNQSEAWRNPDLSVGDLISGLSTNRTYLREAMQQNGYDSYTSYINRKRIAEFIRIIEQQGEGNYLHTFFDVGFRSKATALRNFREFTGMTPTEYFQQQVKDITFAETTPQIMQK